MLSNNEIKKILEGIFWGDITEEDLPVKLYLDIADYLKKGLYKGYGGELIDFDGKDLELLEELRTNIYMFSAAKTYQEVRTMTDLLYNEDDKVKPFDEFFKDARALYDNYNVNYAQTEYNTAVASGQMGIRWNQIEADKDVLPLLKMTVVEDAQTTEICEPLDGITLPVDDPFWDEFYPPNHWNCRSTVLQLDEGEVSSKAEIDKAKEHADEDMQDVFKMNVGKDGYVFSPEHPYFTNAPKDLKENNFNLEIPEND
jgi:SPP1 gp7 family putative phage head morphogenesis protein